MGKNEIYWAIFSGKVMLSFTIRLTKGQCKYDYMECRVKIDDYHPDDRKSVLKTYWQKMQGKGYSCKKVVINEHKGN